MSPDEDTLFLSVKLGEIALRIGAEVSAEHAGREVCNLLTDSRSLTEPAGTLFFALHTHTGDGHFYLQSLYARGVRMFVVERVPEQLRGLDDAVMLVVKDTLQALQTAGIAAAGYNGTTIAVCGSRGKTIIKEWLYGALQVLGAADGGMIKVQRSPRSFNSQTGVPLSLWQIEADTDYAIIEAGISRKGEMERLECMVKPEIVLYTGIDEATHADGFKSVEEKAREKALMAVHAGTVVYDADVSPLAEAVEAVSSGRRIIWSRKNSAADIYIKDEQRRDGHTYVSLVTAEKELCVDVPFVSDAEVEDAIAVMAALHALGYSSSSWQRAMDSLKPVRTRMDVMEGLNGCTVAVDGYESDIASLPEAIDYMRRHSVGGQRLTLVVSDLQGAGEDEYNRFAALCRNMGVDRLIAVGSMMRQNLPVDGHTEVYDNAEALLAALSVADFSGEFVMVKGTPGDGLERVAEMLAARKHETVLEVNLGALARNYATYKSRLPEGTRITAMVKASAYGMGSYEVARTLQDAGAAYLAVAVLDEGLELRRRGITMPVMVMNPKAVNYRSMFADRLEPEIYSAPMLEEVIAEASHNGVTRYPVHIKIDTGMHRTGFDPDEIPALCDRIISQTQVEVASVFSHLATADCMDMDAYTLGQVETFERITAYMQSRLPRPFLRHILNSAGMVRFPQYAFDMARLGIGLYGVNTLPPPVENVLEPVARLRTVIISLREVAAGEAVGYGRTGKVEKPSVIATLPIGYADGFNRHFGRGAVSVRVGGKDAPTIGNVCMDQCMIDVTGIECSVGDEVEIFGPQLSLERLATVLDTIPYEILTSISPRVKRLYYRE